MGLYMLVHGKKGAFFRILGSFLILMSLILSTLFNILALNNFILYILLMCIILPSFLLSVVIKLEQGFFIKNTILFLILIATETTIITFVVFFSFRSLVIMKFMLIESSNLLLIICWHFSLSLYRRLKILFALSGISFFVLIVILWIGLEEPIVIILFITPTLLSGLLFIIITEFRMKKKGLLNYI